MAKDGKDKSQTQLVPARRRKAPPRKWNLTEQDKRFLRRCNIRPE
ncbi:MAG TPA: hypothetical protein VLV83_25000 [Acidobacteriota bacterium]|nr:hypothetical protein [Acidobacteriota bacterium]